MGQLSPLLSGNGAVTAIIQTIQEAHICFHYEILFRNSGSGIGQTHNLQNDLMLWDGVFRKLLFCSDRPLARF